MNDYERRKGNAIEEAIAFQSNFESMSWGQVVYYNNYFEKLGKRYGLLKEFRENGVI